MASISSNIDVCDLNRIYNDNFTNCVPKALIEAHLNGTSFGGSAYTEEEKERLIADINAIYQEIILSNPEKGKLAVFTAGAPGAGKTTLMEAELESWKKSEFTFAYVDPDAVCLKKMKHTFEKEISASLEKEPDNKKAIQLAAYNKWRAGSNAAAQIIVANLIRDNYAFYFGTTASSPFMGQTFQFLKERGYEIKILHVTAPDDVRVRSIKERDKEFVQTTDEDIVEKGKLVPQRISDCYLKYANLIRFEYRKKPDAKAVTAAVWTRIPNSTKESPKGYLIVNNPRLFRVIIKINENHNSDWEKCLREASE